MITKMNHYTFLVYHNDYNEFLSNIQELGVLHVTPTKQCDLTENIQYQTALSDAAKYTKVIEEMLSVLKRKDIKGNNHNVGQPSDVSPIIAQWQALCDDVKVEQKNIEELDNEIKVMQPWGDFSHESLDGLKKAGWEVRFWTISPKEYNANWETEYHATLVKQDKKGFYFITVTPNGSQIAMNGASEVTISPSPTSTLIIAQTKAKDSLKSHIEQRADFALAHYAEVEAAKRALMESIDLQKVKLTTADEAEGKVMFLEGYVPTDKADSINRYLNEHDIFFTTREAGMEDNAPIKLKNNAFTSMYECLTAMYGMPVYGEFDPTPIVAIFFSIFFAFCIGDAGYGLLLILLGFFLKKKMGPSNASLMNLVMTLGVFTTIGGLILGTAFGIDLYKADFAAAIHPYMISGKIDGTGFDKQMVLALIIGVVHISLAMLVRCVGNTIRYGFKNTLSLWGWFLFIEGSVITGALQYFNVIDAGLAKWLYIGLGSVSAIGIYLLNDLKRNVFLNIGAGLWDTYNMATGLLGDVLSYIRLYALGLAGAMLGGVFNQLAFMAGDACPIGLNWIVILLILILGHTLNLAMSCLSAFVHPLRLTFVEYFKNSGYEGKGEKYNPLATAKNED